MKSYQVVIGGGISGLISALILSEQNKPVVLIERENELGGLLRSFDYGEWGRFDYGAHNCYETGIKALDDLMLSLLPESDWQFFEGNRRDLAGLYLNGRLQKNSLYPDLRRLPTEVRDRYLLDFFKHLNTSPALDSTNASTHLRSWFGASIAETVFEPALRKIYRRPPEMLAAMATHLTSMGRVVLFDEAPFLDLMNATTLRDRLAFPEQRNLPPRWQAGLRSFYPRKYGMYRLIEALQERLLRAGVTILTGTHLLEVHVEKQRVIRVRTQAGDSTDSWEVDDLHWTVGMPMLAPWLEIDIQRIPFDPPLKTVLVNLVLDRPLDVGDLYYFYVYDEGFDTFRVTCFYNYCEEANRAGGVPVCLEMLVPLAVANDPDALAQRGIDELRRLQVWPEEGRVLFSQTNILTSGFPLPTTKNIDGMQKIRQQIIDLSIENLNLLGILSEPDLFFQKDVILQAWKRFAA